MTHRPHTIVTLLLAIGVITVISVISVITVAINDSLRCDALCLLIGRIQLLTGDTLQHNRQTRTLHYTKKRASLFMCVPLPTDNSDYADYADYSDYTDYDLVLSPLLLRHFVRIAVWRQLESQFTG
jgi:hypothetical protein